jgi:uncharacterized OsmC-like protein
MVKITIGYAGGLHCNATHGPSGSTLGTDAPVDNHGKGETFSPTDLVATALGACMATVMGIYAERHGIDLTGMRVEVQKEMSADAPRRIVRLITEIWMPVPHDPVLERTALTCPVRQSLNTEIPVTWHWAEGK